jgi:hypothetical protein
MNLVALRNAVRDELRCFRRLGYLLVAGSSIDSLSLWRRDGSSFPLFVELARTVLAPPRSKIVCERVLSLVI